jgi:Domain of unknown function (DUF5753)
MREQLARLIEVSRTPNVDLHVLPSAARAHPAVMGEFTILRFPEVVAPDVVYLENMTSNLYVEREAEVFRYALAFDRLMTVALGTDESVSLISGLADSL